MFFPTMAKRTRLEPFATFFIASNESPTLPIFTKLDVILEEVGLPPKILKVVCIHTLSFVVFVIVRTPFCFEIEDVGIVIWLQDMMKETHFDIFH